LGFGFGRRLGLGLGLRLGWSWGLDGMQVATARAWSATDCSALATPLHASCTAASHTSLTSCCGIWLTENSGGMLGAAAVLFLADGSENGGGSSEASVCQKRKGLCVFVARGLGAIGRVRGRTAAGWLTGENFLSSSSAAPPPGEALLGRRPPSM